MSPSARPHRRSSPLRRALYAAVAIALGCIALGSAQEALRLALDLDDRARISLSTNALACFFERSGDPWQAERLMVEALTLARGQADRHPIFTALNNLGAALIGKFFLLRDTLTVEEAREPLRSAQPYVEESVQMARAGGDAFPLVFCQGNLAEILVHLGEGDAAEPLLAEALDLAQPHGFEAQVWRLGCTRGELLLSRGQAQAALFAVGAGQPAARARKKSAWRIWDAPLMGSLETQARLVCPED